MKKILSVIMAVLMLFTAISALNMITFAETDELIENGDFEEGDDTGFQSVGPACDTDVDGEYAHSGEYGFAMTNRSAQYAVWGQDITDVMIECGPGKYKASMWCRLADEDAKAQCMLVIKVISAGNETSYFTSGYKTITSQWQQFLTEQTIDFDLDKVKTVQIYPQCFDAEKNGIDMYMDDVSLKKTSEVNGREVVKDETDELLEDLPKVDMKMVSEETREETTTLGAIRWDAWYGDDAKDQSVLKQVEKSLSPAKYHFRAPFFAKVTDDGKITIPTYTQEIFDKEMEYAIEAGIDYFAYCWYDTGMRAARDFHKTSKYRDQVKLCALMDGNGICQDYARKEMAELLQQSYYMTVFNGRPLMYYFATNDNIDKVGEDIVFYRQLCAKLGIPEPYAVIMNTAVSSNTLKYGDATSKYGLSGSDGMPFMELVQDSYEQWEGWRKNGGQYVPAITTGWHTGTRYENPVTWTTCAENSWVEYATPEEITEHIEYTYRYMQQSAVSAFTMANTMIMYAWNEHDEGGWICPTIAVDENGNQLYNDDGTPKINDERVQAVKKAVQAYKNGELVGEIDLTKLGDATVVGKTNDKSKTGNAALPGWAIPVIIGGVVVVAGVVVILVVVKKKKKAE